MKDFVAKISSKKKAEVSKDFIRNVILTPFEILLKATDKRSNRKEMQ